MIRPGVVEWDASGGCDDPVFRSIIGHPTDQIGRALPRWGGIMYRGVPFVKNATRYLDMWVPCRRCRTCLRRKAAHWRLRAMTECSRNRGRTWMGSMTLSPYWRSRLELEARAAVGNSEFASLSAEQRTAQLAKQGGKYVTLWLKRVREQSGAALRFLLTCEPHKDGVPHWHVLLHEVGDKQVRHKVLKRQWTHGFSDFHLVEDGPSAAGYVAKYISKSPLTRVRASVGYGQGGEEISTSGFPKGSPEDVDPQQAPGPARRVF